MTQQPESVDWFAACREASAYAFTLKAELRSVEEKNRLLHQRHHDDNVEYTRVLTQRDALLEALKYHQEQTRPIQRTLDVIKTVEETK